VARRLTDRQVAVLAAVERLGHPTIPELHTQFPALAPSEIHRVLKSLINRGRVEMSGNPTWVYLGEPPPGFGHPVPAEEVVRFRARPSRAA
jgi:DNA-binding IclR family transcriptional regulator